MNRKLIISTFITIFYQYHCFINHPVTIFLTNEASLSPPQLPELTNIGDWPTLDNHGNASAKPKGSNGGGGGAQATTTSNNPQDASAKTQHSGEGGGGGKKSSAVSPVVVGEGGQSSSATSDDITNQENRPLNGSGERTKKTSRKKWVPMAIDVRTSRGGRKERPSSGAAGANSSIRPGGGGGRTRNRDSTSRDATGAQSGGGGGASGGESWRGDTERRATSFGKNLRGPRPPSAAAATTGGATALPNGGPAYRRPHPSRRVASVPVGTTGYKKGEQGGRLPNGKVETGTGVPLTELKNGAPLYYVPANYRADDPLVYLKECIRHQM